MKKKYYSRYLILCLLVAVTYFTLPRQSAKLQKMESPGALFTVTNNLNTGAGSFRQAVIDANAAAGLDTIQFAVGTGPVEITLTSALPDITQPVIIDGTTQPGFSGIPLITLSGNFSGGMRITGGGSTVKAITLTRFTNGIVLENAGGNIVTGNYIGRCPPPALGCSNSTTGVRINNSPNNVIGGATAATRNIIGNNNDKGIEITGGASTGNIITGNHIGLLADGSPAGNGNFGVAIIGASNNRVGGASAGERNFISANAGFCNLPPLASNSNVFISGAAATGNSVEGNFIGTTIDGMDGNSPCVGVRIDNAANNTIGGTVGTTPGGACTGACNLISGYGGIGNQSGVTIAGSGSTGNSVLGNFIGTNAAGTARLDNDVSITITNGASNNTIGGTTAAGRNLINNGIWLSAAAAMNTVQGNYIGTDTTGNIGIGFISGGQVTAALTVENSPNNRIGTATGTTLGGACTGGCNLISGNNSTGIEIKGSGSTGNRVDYNYIGLNAAGTTALRNNGSALALQNGANNNTIGRPLTATPFQKIGACADNAPQAIRCTQDGITGDWVRFNDQTGEYTWMNCRSGVTMSGVGEVTNVGSLVKLRAPGVGVEINTATGLGAATIVPPPDSLLTYFLISDRNVSDSTCVCPTEGLQTVVGTVANGVNNDQNPPNNNKFNRFSIGWDARAIFRLSTPADGYVQNLAGNFSEYRNLDMATSGGNFAPLSIRIGTDILYSGLSINALNSGIYTNLPIDLNDNQIRDPNDPLDADGGANRTQNHPENLAVHYEGGGNKRLTGTFNGTPNKRFLINIKVFVFFPTNIPPIAQWSDSVLSFEIMTDGNGNAQINQSFTGAGALRPDVDIAATATLIDQVPINSENGIPSLVDVLGDTSEMSLPAAVPQPKLDFDEDGKTDIAVYRPGVSQNDPSYWYVLNSSDLTVRIVQFGNGEDKSVAGDYQGDGVADFAVFRPSTGTWYHSRLTGNPATNFVAIQWGVSTDIPVVGDFDDDGANDAAVFRPSERNWYLRSSLTGSFVVQQWGLTTDKLVPADYNGDGRTDVAVFRPSDGTWYISTCPGCTPRYTRFGLAGDVPVPGDYDGDGSTDIAVWRPSDGNWYLLQSTAGFAVGQWGVSSDKPLKGDFDADGKNDLAIWRPSTGDWWILKSTDLSHFVVHWGQNGDIPVPMFPNAP